MPQKYIKLITWVNIVWVLIILILCIMPGKDIPNTHLDIPHLDKVVHFGMFFILSLLLTYRLDLRSILGRKQIYIISLVTAFLYGGCIEILQHYFFDRSGDFWDLLADVLGGIAGGFCYSVGRRFFPHTQNHHQKQ